MNPPSGDKPDEYPCARNLENGRCLCVASQPRKRVLILQSL